MQGLHHQQKQLAALLNVALPKGGGDSASSSSSASNNPSSEGDEPSRLAAINSLHRAILYPPNSILVTHSASFLSHGFSQLLSDKTRHLSAGIPTTLAVGCCFVVRRRRNFVTPSIS